MGGSTNQCIAERFRTVCTSVTIAAAAASQFETHPFLAQTGLNVTSPPPLAQLLLLLCSANCATLGDIVNFLVGFPAEDCTIWWECLIKFAPESGSLVRTTPG